MRADCTAQASAKQVKQERTLVEKLMWPEEGDDREQVTLEAARRIETLEKKLETLMECNKDMQQFKNNLSDTITEMRDILVAK